MKTRSEAEMTLWGWEIGKRKRKKWWGWQEGRGVEVRGMTEWGRKVKGVALWGTVGEDQRRWLGRGQGKEEKAMTEWETEEDESGRGRAEERRACGVGKGGGVERTGVALSLSRW